MSDSDQPGQQATPKRIIITAPIEAYPEEIIRDADLVIRDRRVLKYRQGVMNCSASDEEFLSCEVLELARARGLVGRLAAEMPGSPGDVGDVGLLGQKEKIGESPLLTGWQGTPPAEGTRRKLILDTIKLAYKDGGRSMADSALADAIESALLRRTIDDEAMARGADIVLGGLKKVDPEARSRGVRGLASSQMDSHRGLRRTDPGFAEYHRGAEEAYRILYERLDDDEEREADAQDAIANVGEVLDQIDAPQAATFAQRIQRLYRELRDQITRARTLPAPAGIVRPGTRELHIVLAAQPGDDPSEFFVELEDQDGRGIGGFESRQGDPGTRRIVIPYGRDDEWVQQVAMAAILAGQDVDQPFPAGALDELLREFGIEPKLPREWPGRSETVYDRVIRAAHAGPEVDDTDDDDEAEYVGEAYDDRLLRQREEAREGESRFAEERDCAYALLRWLLPVVVPKRMD